jgi:hypothetical protein
MQENQNNSKNGEKRERWYLFLMCEKKKVQFVLPLFDMHRMISFVISQDFDNTCQEHGKCKRMRLVYSGGITHMQN